MADGHIRSGLGHRLFLFLACLAFMTVVAQRWAGAEPESGADQAQSEVIKLEEVPTWEVGERIRRYFIGGTGVLCREKKLAGVTYPTLKCDKPLFGVVSIRDARLAPERSSSMYFVLDRASGGDGDYDLLYIDRNGSGDLTDEKPLKPLAQTPDGLLLRYSRTEQQTCFEPIEVPCDFGPAGVRPIELYPRFLIRQGRYATLALVPAKAYRGGFSIAGRQYDAYLGYQGHVEGRLDRPGTGLFLMPKGGDATRWVGGNNLKATHRLGGKLYRFSCSPTGDELTMSLYTGPLGTFELGAGDRDVTKLEMQGSLQGDETSIPVEEEDDAADRSRPIRTCQVPTGHYYPAYLTITLDDLQIGVSNNYYVEAGQPPRSGTVKGIEIRQGKPFVLDFSNEPKVIFAEPMKGLRVRPGDQLRIQTVLVDPKLDIMIRRVYGLSEDGRRSSLEPKVAIKRANGKVVAEGAMPFG